MTCPQLLNSSLASAGAHKLTRANTNSYICRGAPTRSGDTWPNVWASWHTLTGAVQPLGTHKAAPCLQGISVSLHMHTCN